MAVVNLFVIAGGPGAGKTTLLHELSRRGLKCASEVAREIIQQQVAEGGTALPWANREAFADRMLQSSVEQWHRYQGDSEQVFFDRGLPDTLCYARLVDLPAVFRLKAMEACLKYRYAARVFLAPAWSEIYTTDAERKQTFEEAVATTSLMSQTYLDCGYDVVTLPCVSVEQRADFVLSAIR